MVRLQLLCLGTSVMCIQIIQEIIRLPIVERDCVFQPISEVRVVDERGVRADGQGLDEHDE
jgi:hypothetical protein